MIVEKFSVVCYVAVERNKKASPGRGGRRRQEVLLWTMRPGMTWLSLLRLLKRVRMIANWPPSVRACHFNRLFDYGVATSTPSTLRPPPATRKTFPLGFKWAFARLHVTRRPAGIDQIRTNHVVCFFFHIFHNQQAPNLTNCHQTAAVSAIISRLISFFF